MKHAYLIIAHNEFGILEKQLRLLDDPRNDFYIHIDKKVKDFPFEKFRNIPQFSKVYFSDRLDVCWGEYTQIQAELVLLKAAIGGNYRYYHLLSGVDLPLKSNNEIHGFFRDNDGRELVHFCAIEPHHRIPERVNRYHWHRLRGNKLLETANSALCLGYRILRKLGYERNRELIPKLAFGANWFSITHELAEHVVGCEKWIARHFRWGASVDELFLQTIVANSEFNDRLYRPEKDNDYRANMCLIDWDRGNGANPWIFRMEDFEMLQRSSLLFARKFSTQVDAQIVDRWYDYIAQQNKAK